MEQEKRRIPIWKRLTGPTAATVCFLIVAGLFVYACAALLSSILRREMLHVAPKEPFVQSTPAITPQSSLPPVTESVRDVAAMLIPAAPAPDTDVLPLEDGMPEPSDIPASTPAPSPAPTLLPIRKADSFSAGQAEFVFLGYDTTGRADWIVIVQMQDAACRVLSVPRNTLPIGGQPALGQTATVNRTLEQLCGVWPVQYRYYIDLQLPGLPRCVDLLGGVTIDGAPATGENTLAYLNGAGADEMLRIVRQQDVMRACLDKLHALNPLKLITAKFTLEKYVGSNLTTTQLIALFSRFQRTPLNQITFATLPVDSVVLDNTRYYTPDITRINQMLAQ